MDLISCNVGLIVGFIMNKRKCKYVFVFLTAVLFVSVSGVNASIFGRVRKYKPNPVFCPKPIKVLDEFVGKSLPLNDDTSTVNLWGEEVELEINPIRLDDGNDEMEMAMAMSSAIEPNQFDPDDVVILDGGFVTESMELSSYSANPRQGGPNGRATGKGLVQIMQYQGSEADPNSWDIITSNVGWAGVWKIAECYKC